MAKEVVRALNAVEIMNLERTKATTRIQIAQSLWKRMELDWKLEPQQLAAFKLIEDASKTPNNRFVLNASRRWGKTFLMAIIAILYAMKHPNCMILYAGSTQKAVKDFIVPTFHEIFKDSPDELRAVYKTQLNQFSFPNGSKIKITGLDAGRLQKLRGITAHLIIVDEAGFIDDLHTAVTSVLFPMTSTTGGQTILASNAPMTAGHDFVKIFTRQAEESGNYLKQTIYNVPKFSTQDVERFAKITGGKDSSTFKREYLCEHTVDEENAVIPEWGSFKEMLVKRDIQRPEFFYSLVAIDIGLIDFTGVVFGYWNFPNGCAVIEDELLLRGTNSEKLVKACRQKESELWGAEPFKQPNRVADGQAFTINDICTVHKYPVGVVSKDNVEAQANAIRLDVQSGKLFIHPRCVKLLGQLEDATWNKARTEFTRNKADGHFDLVAALQYFVRHVNRSSNPFPEFYRMDVANMRIRDRSTNNASHDALKKLFTKKS